MSRHHNKTLAAALALFAGAIGAHRFYLRSSVDRLGLLHLMAVPACGLIYGTARGANPFWIWLPLLVSYIAALVEGLVIGTMPDPKFDARYNAGSEQASASSWLLAAVLVTTLAMGAIVAIATISRLFDLLYTGGSYG